MNISYFFDIDPSDEEDQQRRYTAAAAKWLSQVLAEMRNQDSSYVNYGHKSIESRTVEIVRFTNG